MLIPMVAVKMIAIQKWRCHCIGAPDDNLTDSESAELSSVNVTSNIKAEFDNPARKKRQSCRRHNVHAVSSTETALDEKNYEPIEYPHVAIDHVAVPLEKKV